MPTPIPPPFAADSSGQPDSQWITDVRDALGDYPKPVNSQWTADGTGGVFGAGSAPLILDQGPIYDGTPISTYVAVKDNTAGTTYTVITSGTPTSTQVLLDYDKRTLIFSAAPTNTHVIQVGYYVCRWRDYSILTALYDGLRLMFPTVGRAYVDTSIAIKVDTWDYTLPTWAQSPDAVVTRIEYRDPNVSTEPWRPLNVWVQNADGTIHLPQAQQLSVVGRLRVTGWGPFQVLGDLPPDLYHLPIWHALSVLLPKRESKRIAADTQVPVTQEAAQQPGLLTQTGDYYARRFELALQQKARKYGPPGASRPLVTSYELARHV